MTDDTPTPLGPEAVRAMMDAAEEVHLPPGMDLAEGDPGPGADRLDDYPDDHPDLEGADSGDGPGGDGDGGFAPDPENLRRAARFQINDLGNAQRFVLHFGPDVMYVPRVGWHVWTGRVWQVDPDVILVRRQAQRLSELVLAEVPYLTLAPAQMERIAQAEALEAQRTLLNGARDDDGRLPPDKAAELARIDTALADIAKLKASLSKFRTAHRTFARSTGNSAKIKAALTEAEVPLAQPVEVLDVRPLDVNTQSCVIRFEVTPRKGTWPLVEVREVAHDRALRMTKIMEAGFDPAATCPIFHAFIERIMPDPEMRAFLQRWFGYSMLGLTNEQALAFFYGMGANGKSALTDLMARLMGSYAATAKIESLTGTNRRSAGDATPDLVNIVAARMVRASEPEKGVQWQEGLIKQLTGGEPILVRALQENFIEITPIFKLTIGGNHAPDIRGMDDGIWRRLMIVPFDVQIPKEERDPMIVHRMLDEAAGILNWLIEGARAYLEMGLAPPVKVARATDDLRADADPWGKFLDDACVVTGDEADSITSRELMLCFKFWQIRRGEQPYKDRTITTAMKEHSRRWRSPKTGHQFKARETGRFNGYDGLRLTEMFKTEWDRAPKDTAGNALTVAAAQREDEGGMASEF